MNLLEVDKDDTTKITDLKKVATYATDKGYEVVVDVNPDVYKTLGLPKNEIDFFADLNISGIRLDEDFGGEIEAELSNNKRGLLIELNASAGSATFDKAIELGANPKNLVACHNFYPMEYTALSREAFVKLSSHYKAKGARTGAFLTLPPDSDTVGPWTVNDGYPTIEDFRHMDLKAQILEFLRMDLISDILIPTQPATEEQFQTINDAIKEYEQLMANDFIELEIEFFDNATETEKEIILDNKGKDHETRPDINPYFIRSSLPRHTYKEKDVPVNNTGHDLKLGDVVVLNKNKGRYKCEPHIIINDLKDIDNVRNYVGRVAKKDLYKLPFINIKRHYKAKEAK